MHYTYRTRGTCSQQIDFDMDENEVVTGIRFTGGCNGNLKGIASLAEGMKASDIIDKTQGILCGFKPTSCPDQLSLALKEALGRE